ncbi:MAG TPA: VWA domain-containing protein [Candidatus Nitrosotenuis sp.]|nr:VWA domain-containing protein [Candidatus Nitrosotenuis sp.]
MGRPYRKMAAQKTLLFFLVLGSALLAQEAPPALRILHSEAAGNNLLITVSVTDASGRPVRELSAANFQVQVEGEPVKDLKVERSAEKGKPLSVMLLIDVSGSMKGAGIETARKAALALVDQLEKDDYCAVIAFGSDVRQVVEFTREKFRVREAINKLDARDAQTHLYQALFEALERTAAAPSSRTAIIALTDGKDEGSGLEAQDVIQKASSSGVPLFLLGFGPRAKFDVLQRIASLTRGAFYSTPDPAELTQIYLSVLEQLKINFQLNFAFPRTNPGRYAVSILLNYRGSAQTVAQQLAWAPGSVAGVAPAPTAAEEPSRWMRWSVIAGVVLIVVAIAGGVWFFFFRAKQEKSPEMVETIVAPRVWLEVVRGADTGLKLPLVLPELTIGRSPEKSQMVLRNDPMVGRAHARIQKNSRGQYVLEDLGSANGTMVNGVTIEQPVVLQPNDRIEIGQTEMIFLDNR